MMSQLRSMSTKSDLCNGSTALDLRNHERIPNELLPFHHIPHPGTQQSFGSYSTLRDRTLSHVDTMESLFGLPPPPAFVGDVHSSTSSFTDRSLDRRPGPHSYSAPTINSHHPRLQCHPPVGLNTRGADGSALQDNCRSFTTDGSISEAFDDDNSDVVEADVTEDHSVEVADLPPIRSTHHFQMSDTPCVTQFFQDCLDQIQETANKKIAKAFIRAICPQKQAKFPYKTKNCPRPPKPTWWPEPYVCRFQEPDHVGKKERHALLIHMLRLMPTPQQFDNWNRGKNGKLKPHPKLELAGRDWVHFLKDFITSTDLECPNDTPEKLQHRQNIFKRLMQVADLEESFRRSGSDPGYHYGNHEEGPKQANRSNRRKPVETPAIPDRRKRAKTLHDRDASFQAAPIGINGQPTTLARIAQYEDSRGVKLVADDQDRSQSVSRPGQAASAKADIGQSTVQTGPNLAALWKSCASDHPNKLGVVEAWNRTPGSVRPSLCYPGSAPSPVNNCLYARSSGDLSSYFGGVQPLTNDSSMPDRYNLFSAYHDGTFRPSLQAQHAIPVAPSGFDDTSHALALSQIPTMHPTPMSYDNLTRGTAREETAYFDCDNTGIVDDRTMLPQYRLDATAPGLPRYMGLNDSGGAI